ncbi:uncharacterized protein LOC123698464 [Colias croceus]|uniref:uncharacterized protein LOC123698464 n=1 Tax=Colias crocea TaxID=72248 RepID=UPI001E27FC13|nr:uncharacterized protein LOC123698464 [Colias croceus]CAG4935440.1 unnamed protein product [Colias eurytheme]
MKEDSDNSALAERIAEFKSDPEKLRQASEFVDQLIQQAKKEAEIKHKEKERSKFESQELGSNNLKRRFGRARGFMLRMFDALCNCTQTAAAAARTHARNNPFTKR